MDADMQTPDRFCICWFAALSNDCDAKGAAPDSGIPLQTRAPLSPRACLQASGCPRTKILPPPI